MMKIRIANHSDLVAIHQLGYETWSQYKKVLSIDNWEKLAKSIGNIGLYADLLATSTGFVCEHEGGELMGMSFLVSKGHPTDIYTEHQCYIRFVTVPEKYKGLRIGQQLTEQCIAFARASGEKEMALHTSEFMDKARHIYEKLGFKVIKEIEPRFGKRYWLYGLDL